MFLQQILTYIFLFNKNKIAVGKNLLKLSKTNFVPRALSELNALERGCCKTALVVEQRSFDLHIENLGD